METISARLRWAINRTGRSLRDVQQELAKRGVRGSSYASFHGYVTNPDEIPPLELLTAAADVLGVRPAWLAFNEGEPTEEGERLRQEMEDREEELGALLEERLPIPGGIPEVLRALFFDTLARWWFARKRILEEAGQEAPTLEEVADDVIAAMLSPLRYWAVGSITRDRFTEYAIAMLHALRVAMPDPEEGAIQVEMTSLWEAQGHSSTAAADGAPRGGGSPPGGADRPGAPSLEQLGIVRLFPAAEIRYGPGEILVASRKPLSPSILSRTGALESIVKGIAPLLERTARLLKKAEAAAKTKRGKGEEPIGAQDELPIRMRILYDPVDQIRVFEELPGGRTRLVAQLPIREKRGTVSGKKSHEET